MTLTRYLTVIGMSSVVWQPRKYKTGAGKGNQRPALKRIQAYKNQRRRHHACESPGNENLRRTSPRGQQGPRRPRKQGEQQPKDEHQNGTSDGRADEYGQQRVSDISSRQFETNDSPSYERKVEQRQRGPAASAEEQPRDDGTTKGAAGTIIFRNFCPPTQVNLNKKEGARELCGVATAEQCLSQQPLAKTQYSAEK